ncbi:MAG TPA: ATP-binding protein [Candidatus Nanopelagicales bacterium]|nr:ATP-binding protein [Candidatus Nanopelagicales bacterium]
MRSRLLSLYSLKFNPFRPDIPTEALHVSPAADAFVRRIRHGISDGGFSMIHGPPGTGKSVVLRLISEDLRTLPDVVVGTIEHPQSRTADFYRELGDVFGVTLSAHNRWGSFKALRARWSEHVTSTLMRPVLIIDEAQETLPAVLNEMRTLASKDLDAKQLLCVIFAGDERLPERLSTPELLPLGSRIRRRLKLEYAPREELLTCLDHLLQSAGNAALMTPELKATLVDHAAGNHRILMNLCDELLAVAADREMPRLDEKLYFDVFAQSPRPKPAGRKR